MQRLGLDGDVDGGADREAEALGGALRHERLQANGRVHGDEDVPALQGQADYPTAQGGSGGRPLAGPLQQEIGRDVGLAGGLARRPSPDSCSASSAARSSEVTVPASVHWPSKRGAYRSPGR